MRRGGLLGRAAVVGAAGAAAVAVLAGIAVAERPVQRTGKDFVATFDAGFRPKALSRTVPTPVALEISGDIASTVEWQPPPQLREFILEGDENFAVNVRGLPICRADQLLFADTALAESACRSAILGRGHITLAIRLPGDRHLPFDGKTVVFNGGVRGGITTLRVHAYLAVPSPTTIVFTVEIRRIHRGRYGLLAVTKIPEILEGDGLVTHLDLEVRKRGALSAKCTDGTIQVRGTAKFADQRPRSETVIRRCMPKP